jgi:hypothetical protein
VSKWRVGRKVGLNVYAGERPVCQCHTEAEAKLIVEAVNAWNSANGKTARLVRHGEEPADADYGAFYIVAQPTDSGFKVLDAVEVGLGFGQEIAVYPVDSGDARALAKAILNFAPAPEQRDLEGKSDA